MIDKKPTMSNYTIDNSPVTSGVLTTSYSYGTTDKEYVFSCKGRPFAALVSPKLPTNTASSTMTSSGS